MKKITLTTIKKFIRDNRPNLYIKVKSSFDGMSDMVESIDGAQFKSVVEDTRTSNHTLGIQGAWFVFDSRDHFDAYDKNGFQGYEVYNCCGSFVLAIRK